MEIPRTERALGLGLARHQPTRAFEKQTPHNAFSKNQRQQPCARSSTSREASAATRSEPSSGRSSPTSTVRESPQAWPTRLRLPGDIAIAMFRALLPVRAAPHRRPGRAAGLRSAHNKCGRNIRAKCSHEHSNGTRVLTRLPACRCRPHRYLPRRLRPPARAHQRVLQ